MNAPSHEGAETSRSFELIVAVVCALHVSGPVAAAQLATGRARDSSAVRMVQADAMGGVGPRVRLAARPDVQIGGLESRDPSVEFNMKQGYLSAARRSDGGLVVFDGHRVQFFSPTGTRVTIVGREGRGPGEFLTISAGCITRGDTVVASDANTRRITILDGQGMIVRSFPQARLGALLPASCSSDGSFILARPLLPPPPGPPARWLALSRVRTDGAVIAELGEADGGSLDPVTQRQSSIVALAADMVLATATRNEFRVYHPNGDLARIIRGAESRHTIAASEAAQRITAALPSTITGQARVDQEARLSALHTEKEWPAYGRVLSDGVGRLWVQQFRVDRTALDRWVEITIDGELTGQLAIPRLPGMARVEVLAFHPGVALLKWWNPDGAVYFSAYQLIRDGA